MLFVITALFVTSLSISLGCNESPNLITGGDFENGVSDWFCNGNCALTVSENPYQGSRSAYISGRTRKWEGISQAVPIVGDHYYSFKGQIKILNLASGTLYEDLGVIVVCKDSNNNDARVWTNFDVIRVLLNKWVEFGGARYFRAGLHSCHVYIQTPNPEVNYLVDALTLTKVDKIDDYWRKEAEDRIEIERKVPLKIILDLEEAGDYSVEVVQTHSDFGFGSAVGASEFVDEANSAYHDFIVEHFEWATLENALKWRSMEWTEGNINYERPELAIEDLRNNGLTSDESERAPIGALSSGIKVRAHNIFWGDTSQASHLPSWVVPLTGQDLEDQMERRLKYVVNFTKGSVEHWDVNNENLHVDWFEQTLGDAEVTLRMHERAHVIDPDVKLFINEFGVLKNNMATGYRNLALYMKDEGTPLDGIGIQSHLQPSDVDITLMKYRLDYIAETGLPIWITEISMDEADENIKAEALRDILTLYFSLPYVKGFLLWGFWDQKIFKPAAALFEGSNLTPNAAGTAFLELMQQWRTNFTFLTTNTGSETFRCFKGDYLVVVKRDGEEVTRLEFTLDQATTKTITL